MLLGVLGHLLAKLELTVLYALLNSVFFNDIVHIFIASAG